MKTLILILLGSAVWANSYTTNFPATENPISESGMWSNGGTTGGSWGNVQTVGGTPGQAHGTVVSGAPPYNDSTAVLAGTWGPNQTAQATVAINGTDSSTQEEVELRLNTTITSGNITGYEFDCSIIASDPYCIIVRWNGPLNSFSYGHNGTSTWDSNPVTVGVVVHNGDTLKATNVAGLLTLYINGTSEFTATDTTYSGGAPGVGFWNLGGTTGNLLNYGFSAFSATDGLTPTSSVRSPGLRAGVAR